MKYIFILAMFIFGCSSKEDVSPKKYYRLKVTNVDGTVEYSKIVK